MWGWGGAFRLCALSGFGFSNERLLFSGFVEPYLIFFFCFHRSVSDIRFASAMKGSFSSGVKIPRNVRKPSNARIPTITLQALALPYKLFLS
jgi:hypothetical protein